MEREWAPSLRPKVRRLHQQHAKPPGRSLQHCESTYYFRCLKTSSASKRPSCGAAIWTGSWPWLTAGSPSLHSTAALLATVAWPPTAGQHTVGLPIAAEEGLTGVLALQPALRNQALQQPLWQGLSVADLMALDQEGRVVITDHGQFVLLNWYGVAITSDHNADERIALKLRLC
ncbi:uncharacterized protein HaLaN_29413, partial [Haematococcus lacustris]